jgi:hypothetical protein
MFKRLLSVLLVTIFLGAAFSSDVLAGPPWPAVVYKENDICYTPWFDKEMNPISIWGDGIWKLHEFNNSVTLSCHNTLDFSQVATIAQVCAELPDICDQHGAADVRGFECYIYDDYVTYDAHFVINPSGNWTLTCHFNQNDLP